VGVNTRVGGGRTLLGKGRGEGGKRGWNQQRKKRIFEGQPITKGGFSKSKKSEGKDEEKDTTKKRSET